MSSGRVGGETHVAAVMMTAEFKREKFFEHVASNICKA
jgi:hypothetical protein